MKPSENEIAEIVPYSMAELVATEKLASFNETESTQDCNEDDDTDIYPYPDTSEQDDSVEIEVLLGSNSPGSGARKYQGGKYIGEVEDSIRKEKPKYQKQDSTHGKENGEVNNALEMIEVKEKIENSQTLVNEEGEVFAQGKDDGNMQYNFTSRTDSADLDRTADQDVDEHKSSHVGDTTNENTCNKEGASLSEGYDINRNNIKEKSSNCAKIVGGDASEKNANTRQGEARKNDSGTKSFASVPGEDGVESHDAKMNYYAGNGETKSKANEADNANLLDKNNTVISSVGNEAKETNNDTYKEEIAGSNNSKNRTRKKEMDEDNGKKNRSNELLDNALDSEHNESSGEDNKRDDDGDDDHEDEVDDNDDEEYDDDDDDDVDEDDDDDDDADDDDNDVGESDDNDEDDDEDEDDTDGDGSNQISARKNNETFQTEQNPATNCARDEGVSDKQERTSNCSKSDATSPVYNDIQVTLIDSIP